MKIAEWEGCKVALIKCKECSADISDQAEACPKCGMPLDFKVQCLECKEFFSLTSEVCPKCGLFNSQRYKEKEVITNKITPPFKDNIRLGKKDSYKYWLVGAICFILLIVVSKTQEKLNANTSNNGSKNNVSSTNNNSDKLKDPKNIGQTLSTRYFDVVVNKVNIVDRIDTGNIYSDIKPEKGIVFLVLTVTFKNTDNESRMITDGKLFIRQNGKTYEYDHSETILAENWGILLDTINPLVTKTTKIVYKISNETNGIALYQPGRAVDDELIYLGNLN